MDQEKQQSQPEQPQPEFVELEGMLDRIKFSGRDGWVIGLVVSGRDRVTVKGTLPENVHEGDDVLLSGKWSDDPKYGKQFDFVGATHAIPKATAGVRKWLTKHIEGIGDRGAQMLVERFGVEAPKVLEPRADSTDDPLLDLPGMTPEKAAIARDCFAELGNHPDQQLWLAKHGLVGAYAGRIVRTYKGETRTVLEADPYKPMFEIDGFGFKRSDEFAKKLGVRDHDPRRAKAAILHAFDEQAQSGHVFLNEDELEIALAKDFSVPIEATKDARRALVAESYIVEEGKTTPRYYRRDLRDAEVSICFDLFRVIEAGKLVDPLVPVPDASLNEEQAKAVEFAAQHPILGITGGPGTGKSHTLRAIINQVDPGGRSTLLMAPTGKAAKRMAQATGMPASTVHRGLEYGPNQNGHLGFQRNRRNKLAQKVVVVDELSMLDTSLAAALFEAIPEGARVILVGDVDQLPSVGPGTVLKDLLECELFPVVRLVKNMRSKEGGAIANAAMKVVRGEKLTDEDLTGDVSLLEVENAETAAKEIVRIVAAGVPGYDRSQVQVLCPKRIHAVGVAALNVAIQAVVNPSTGKEVEVGDSKFRPGDKVIVTKNEYDLDVFNGDTGVVKNVDTGLRKDGKRVGPRLLVALDDGREVVFEKEHVKLLSLAYAISVHRSQGSEYPVVVMPVHTCDSFMLFRNLFYTALTRAREKVILVGERKAIVRAIRNQDPTQRNTSLWARLRHLAQHPEKLGGGA